MDTRDVLLTVKQVDILIDDEEVIFEGPSSILLDERVSIYRFSDSNDVFTEIYINDDEYLIKRSSEYKLNIHLTNKDSNMVVTNEIGTLKFVCTLDSFVSTNNQQVIEYSVLDNAEVVGKYRLDIAWKESNE